MSDLELNPPGETDDQRDTVDLVRGAVTSLLGKLALASRPLATLLISNFLGPAILGLYRTAWQMVWIGFKVARFGLHRGIAREVVERRAGGDLEGAQGIIGRGMAFSLTIGVLVGVFITWFAPQLASWFYDKPDLVLPMRIMVWTLPSFTAVTVCIAALRALRQIKYDVFVHSAAGPFILLVGSAVTVLGGWGLIGLSLAQVAMGVGMLILSLFYLTDHYDLAACLRHMWDRSISLVSLLRFSFPVMLSDLINTLVVSVDMLILMKFGSEETVGIYYIARQLSTFIRKPSQAFDPVFGPIIADLTFQKRQRELRDSLAFVTRWTLIINLAYVASVWLLGERLMLIYGEEFASGASAAWILCLGAMAYSMGQPLEGLLIMSGHPRVNLFNNAVWLGSMVLLCIGLIPEYGMLGAAWSASLPLFLVTLMRLVQSYRYLRLIPFRRQLLKPLFAIVLAGLAGSLFKSLELLPPLWSLVPELLILVSVYFFLLYLLGFDERDRMLIARLRRRLRRKRKTRQGSETPSGS